MIFVSVKRAAILVAVGLGACTAGGGQDANVATGVAANSEAGVSFVKLTDAQRRVLKAGVEKMAGAGSRANLGAKAFVKNNGGGTHVCGHVELPAAFAAYSAPSSPKVLPYYVELQDANGQSSAARGQVGTDASKLSKVKFMCRFVSG